MSSFLKHLLGLSIILFSSLSFYFNYEIFNNLSYDVLSRHMINDYNAACTEHRSDMFYVVVNSKESVQKIVVDGDKIMGQIGGVPVSASLSTMTMTATNYWFLTRVMPLQDEYGLFVSTCTIVSYENIYYHNLLAVFVTIIVFLLLSMLYLLFNKGWFCFTFCRSNDYVELN